MNFRLTKLERDYVPTISFVDDATGLSHKNRSLNRDHQVVISLKLANADEKVAYQSGYTTFDKNTKQARVITTPNMAKVVQKHVTKIKNLERYGITTPTSLVSKHSEFDEISEIVLECYNVIMGAWPVDYDPDFDGDEPEEEKLSKESSASE